MTSTGVGGEIAGERGGRSLTGEERGERLGWAVVMWSGGDCLVSLCCVFVCMSMREKEREKRWREREKREWSPTCLRLGSA